LKYGIGSKPVKKQDSYVPGPGTYVINGTPNKKKEPSYGIGTETRGNIGGKSFTPGPGCYNYKKFVGNENALYGFGTGQRGGLVNMKKAKLVPGPG